MMIRCVIFENINAFSWQGLFRNVQDPDGKPIDWDEGICFCLELHCQTWQE